MNDLSSPEDRDTFLECMAESPISSWCCPDSAQAKVLVRGSTLQALGYSQTDFVDELDAYMSLMHPDDRARMANHLHDCVEKKIAGNYDSEFRLKRKDGTYAWTRLELSLFRRKASNTLAAFGVTRIIRSDERVQRTPLGLSQDALDVLLNEIGHPVVLMTADGTILQQNEATQSVIGGAMPSAADKPRFCPFLHEPDGSAQMIDFIDMAICSGQRQEREIFRFNRWWRVHLVPLRNALRDVSHLLLLAEDISAIKAEQEAALAREKALTRTLVREVHHRIKNHLQGLVGLLRSNRSSGSFGGEAIDDAIMQIQSIATVHGLLADNRDVSIDFATLLEKIVATVQVSSNVPVICKIEATCPEFDVPQDDAVPIALAVGELLQNAVKHTPVTPDSRIEGRLSCAGDAIEFSVCNSPARLPDGFSLQSSGNTGLDLVQALLPRGWTTLTIAQKGNAVTARLRLVRMQQVRQ